MEEKKFYRISELCKLGYPKESVERVIHSHKGIAIKSKPDAVIGWHWLVNRKKLDSIMEGWR